MKQSKVEKKLASALKRRKIKFKTQHKIKINNKYHHVDFLVSPKTVVEVDGKLFHQYPTGTSKDMMETMMLRYMGYDVIRIWAEELEKNMDFYVNMIERSVKPMFSFNMF
jgi:very-short-patch-repair endonuclease